MGVPENLLYTKDHEWARLESGVCVVGLTYYAQVHLGDVTFVDLPEPGRECVQFEKMAIVESVKAASEVHAPLSGKVVEINELLKTDPDLINKSPYDQGWIAVVSLKDVDEKLKLLAPVEYDAFLKSIVK